MAEYAGEVIFDLEAVMQSQRHLLQGGMYSTVLARTVVALVFATFAFTIMPVASAGAETRSLKLYFLHTGERDEITFKRNGKYISGGLKKINHFLRDWRRNEPTKMDPKLLDLIWEVYQETGSRQHIHVISAYRSLATNNLLRKRGRGVAKKSQHSLGKALDFFIPGVKLAKLREIGLKKGIGGVGYYPKSGSPFVHFDTGRVRHWPRMTRRELVRIFPNGKTLHVPTDGKPLPGYNIAKARYEKATSGKIVVAKAEEIEKKPNFFAKLLGRDDDDDDDTPSASATPKAVPTVTTAAPATVTPQPQPEEPAVQAENLIAELSPDSVPVPVFAPREIAANTTELVVNQENPESESVQEQLNEQQIAQAVPVPVQATRQDEAIESLALVANTQAPAEQSGNTQVAALSPTEIQDLRREVYSAINTPVTEQPANVTFAAATPDPDRFGPPSVAIASVGRTQERNVPRPQIAVPDATAVQPPRDTAQALASLDGSTESSTPETSLVGYAASGTDNSAATITPVRRPAPATQTALSNQLGNETGLETGIENAVDDNPAATETNDIRLAGIPVPVRNPSRTTALTQTASLDDVSETKDTANSQLSLEQFKNANLNERLVGKWALAADASIAEIADIRPPAYGRNIIRERPDTVLSSGFSRDTIRDFTEGFSGSSLEFLSFTRFRQ